MTFVPAVAMPPIERARCYAVSGLGLAVAPGDQPTVPEVEVRDGDLYLGTLDGAPCVARRLDGDDGLPGAACVPLRQLFGALPEDDFAIATRALGITTWDDHHRFCGRCGAATTRSATERARICGPCKLHHYPRLAPAVIALVERDGKALLARNARYRSAFHSVLAGFVEVGETLEETVAREIHEEAGIAVTDIRYFGSQPWPFTNSLMIGFTARWAGGDLVPDPTELVDAGWFGPDELPLVAPKLSIARALIDDFVARLR